MWYGENMDEAKLDAPDPDEGTKRCCFGGEEYSSSERRNLKIFYSFDALKVGRWLSSFYLEPVPMDFFTLQCKLAK